MSEQVSVDDIAFDEYPNVNGTSRLHPLDNHTGIFEFPSTNGHAPVHAPHHTPIKPSRRLSLWTAIRKLIRKRQESAVVKSVKWQWLDDVAQQRKRYESDLKLIRDKSEKDRVDANAEIAIVNQRIANRDKALDELRQRLERETNQLRETIALREKDIKTHVELEIPKLKRELEVERSSVKYWKALVAEKLVHEEAQIAVENRRLVDAETMIENLRQSQSAQRIQ